MPPGEVGVRVASGFTHTVPGSETYRPSNWGKKLRTNYSTKLACIHVFTETPEEQKTVYCSDRKIHKVRAKQVENKINIYGAIQT